MRFLAIGFGVLVVLAGVGIMKIQFASAPSAATQVNNPLFQPLDPATLKEILPKNRVTLVNMWASWCGPCKAEFPELMELRKRHLYKGLDVVFMSVDRPGDRSEANAYLVEQKVDFLTYFASEPIDDTIRGIAGDWSGAIPASFLFNAKGEKVDSWQGAGNLEEFEAKILPFLAE